MREIYKIFFKFLVLFCIVFTFASVIGYISGEPARAAAKETYNSAGKIINQTTGIQIPEYVPWKLTSIGYVFINNMIIAIIAIVASIYISNYLPPLIVIVQAFPIGILVGGYLAKYNPIYVAANLIPHGVLEMSAIVASCSLGYYFRENRDIATKKNVAGALSLIAIALLIASLIEVYITPVIQVLVAIQLGMV
jgi:uncharacterized membrane protein SpoIIM required for sporulation